MSHLRYGADAEVRLVELIPLSEVAWKSVEPHVCGADVYQAELEFREKGFLLRWRISGDKKDTLIENYYF